MTRVDLKDMRSRVPASTRGEWTVEKFEIDALGAEMHNLHEMFGGGGGRGRYVRTGHYTRLMHGRSVVMSDTDAELSECREAVSAPRGHYLIFGLGLGIVPDAALRLNPNVTKVTIVEVSEDVIALTGMSLWAWHGPARVEIIHGDARTFDPRGKQYDALWGDIWTDLCTDNVDDMTAWNRKRWVQSIRKRGGFVNYWCAESLRYRRRQEMREMTPWIMGGVR